MRSIIFKKKNINPIKINIKNFPQMLILLKHGIFQIGNYPHLTKKKIQLLSVKHNLKVFFKDILDIQKKKVRMFQR